MLFSLLLMIAAQGAGEGPRRAVPLQSLASLVSSSDYPAGALIREAQGSVHFTLEVDKNGMPSGCQVTRSSGDPDLDRATCDLFTARARFTPALDAAGRAVADTASGRITWLLPEEEGLDFKPLLMIDTIYSTEAGVSRCKQRQNDYVWPDLPREGCVKVIGKAVIEQIEELRAPVEVTFMRSFVPQGQTAIGHGDEYGLLMTEFIADLDLAPDGRVKSCRTVSFRDLTGAPPAPEKPDLCLGYQAGEALFAPAADAKAQRRGRMTERVYIKVGVPI